MEKTRIKDKENRRDLRLEISDSLQIRFCIAKKKNFLGLCRKKYASAKNISANGILVELPLKDWQIGRIMKGEDKIVLELKIPNFAKAMLINGKIIWWEKRYKRGKALYMVGISFDELNSNDREKILPLLLNLCVKGKAIL